MRVMHAGDGYRYLLRTVAAGDGDRSVATPLTRYYAETGTPPGRWIGTGVAEFGHDQLQPGAVVTEAQLELLIGMGRDPITGDQLGNTSPTYRQLSNNRAGRADNSAEESGTRQRRAVAGFDFTFSAPKSVAVLWGVADGHTQELIAAAHHAAVADVIGFLEREVAATRTGAAVHDGGIAQVDVAGIAATAFDHWDSRAHDPQLHTHVVVSNKVKTVLDGRWRSLDSRPLHAATVALSELYNAILADRLSAVLGVEWQHAIGAQTAIPHGRSPA